LSAEEVDQYLRGVEEPKRTTLETLRRTILEIIPAAQVARAGESISLVLQRLLDR
jgi:hypothetical protein